MWYQLNSSRSWAVLITAEIPARPRCCWGEGKGNLTTLCGPGCCCGATPWPGWHQSGQGGEKPHVWWWTGVILTQDLLSHGKRASHVGMACAGRSESASAARMLVSVQLFSSLQRGSQPCRAAPGGVGSVYIAAACRSHMCRQCPMLALHQHKLGRPYCGLSVWGDLIMAF